MRKSVLGAAIVATLGFAASSSVAKELKLADFSPPTYFTVDPMYGPLLSTVEEETDGALTIQLYMGGELGPGPAEQYARAVDGVADIVFGLPGYTASNFPKTLLTELPGVIDPEMGTDRILANLDMLSDEYRRVKLLALWNIGPNLLLMANEPVRSLDDLDGLKIRVPSRNAGRVVEAWGGSPVSMPVPEIYNAMQTGVIDGAMTDATSLTGFKLSEVTNYVTQGMDSTISSFFLVMNRDSYDRLSVAEQQVLEDAGREAARNGHDVWMRVGQSALDDFANTDGKEVITLSPEEAERFNAAAAPVVAAVIEEADAAGLNATDFVEALSAD
ncbi:TRAP transporter substrate-binding protein [Mesobaculum littorinae]|uniref:TRAP transporter substrate-binding protein n=1 Tax=Mesobaculum littorinae TaxID=2486419 RepID=A0A438AG07_9RHOB|nr:TRAP transporter substrate-binding protein [Mesobaculum littorinae]RVV97643.1 TRAP transporter substrate-binding protein [Mesobaculum littorinae]